MDLQKTIFDVVNCQLLKINIINYQYLNES
jgi:hypothetical protein